MGADAERVATMRAGSSDPDAVLSALFEQHYERLVGLARLLLDERGQAEEVVQEAFARTYAGWPRVRDRDNPLPYVQRAVVNLARGGLRQRIRARRRPASVVSAAASAEDRALGHQRDRDVAAAVHALPRRQRECVVLRYYLDLSTPETARALGISVGTVKQHVHRALQHLSLVLEDQR